MDNSPLNPDRVRASMMTQLAQFVGEGAVPPTNGGKARPAPAVQPAPVKDASQYGPLHQIWILFDEYKYTEAEKGLTAILEKDPTDWQAYRMRTWARCELGDFKGSIEDANRALKIERRDVEMLDKLAISLTKLGRGQEALPVMQEAIRLNPANSDSYMIRAEVWRTLGQTNELTADLHRALEPLNAWLKQYDSAQEYLIRAAVWRTLGQTNKSAADLQKALTAANRHINKFPKYDRGYVIRAEIWQELGESKKRLADLAKAGELNPRYKIRYQEELKEHSGQPNPPVK